MSGYNIPAVFVAVLVPYGSHNWLGFLVRLGAAVAFDGSQDHAAEPGRIGGEPAWPFQARPVYLG